MVTSFCTIVLAVLYIILHYRRGIKTEWTDFTTTVMAIHTFLSINEVMIRLFTGASVSQSELMKPITIGFAIILFGAYQSILKNMKNDKPDSG